MYRDVIALVEIVVVVVVADEVQKKNTKIDTLIDLSSLMMMKTTAPRSSNTYTK